MSMPTIPEQKHRPDLFETIIDLLESIALEEIAISHLVNAESEKIQVFVSLSEIVKCTTGKELTNFNREVNQFMEIVVMKEWLLLRKLETVLRLTELLEQPEEECEEE